MIPWEGLTIVFCANCGSRLSEGARFCASCGASVPPPASDPAPAAPVVAPAPQGSGYWGATPNAPVTTGWELPATRMAYAGFWRRFAAMILDGIIINMVVYGGAFALGMLIAAGGASDSTVDTLSGLIVLASFVGNWLYFALMESSSMQATLGKKALGIVVTDVNGQRIGFGRATGRYFAKIISSIIFLIGYIMAAFTAKKQALHDMIAGTLVVSGVAAATNPYPTAGAGTGEVRHTQW